MPRSEGFLTAPSHHRHDIYIGHYGCTGRLVKVETKKRVRTAKVDCPACGENHGAAYFEWRSPKCKRCKRPLIGGHRERKQKHECFCPNPKLEKGEIQLDPEAKPKRTRSKRGGAKR